MENIVEKIMESGFECIGIRHLTDDEKYSVGDICRNSYDWDFENDCSAYETTGEELNGTCAINTNIKSYWDEKDDIAEKFESTLNSCKNTYFGHTIAIIGGDSFEYGFDDNEVIIKDAEVIALMEI